MLPVPNSQLLEKLKKFLPEIAQANEELEKKIATDGADSVRIDLQMEKVDESNKDRADIVEEEDDDKEEELTKETDMDDALCSEGKNSEQAERIVELNFALGDFDSTPIANIENSVEDSPANQS